jgi:hypothetical protein
VGSINISKSVAHGNAVATLGSVSNLNSWLSQGKEDKDKCLNVECAGWCTWL